MLKPVKSIEARFANSLQSALLIQKQSNLNKVLLNPMFDNAGRSVIDVYAHGNEAFRLVDYRDAVGNPTHISLDVWNVPLDMWVIKENYPLHENDIFPSWVRQVNIASCPDDAILTAKQGAVLEALSLSGSLNDVVQTEKWKLLLSNKSGVREQLFDSKSALAEFWYETKDVSWSCTENGEHPYLFDFLIAESIFRNDNETTKKHLHFNEDDVKNGALALEENWRNFGTVADLKELLINRHTGDDIVIFDMAISLEHFGCDGELAYDLVCSQKYKQASLLLESVMVNEIKASVFEECWSEAEIDAGELDQVNRRLIIADEQFDVDEIKSCARKYNINKASANSPSENENIWFSSVSPDENREYFEQGISTYYHLHVHSIDGREPNANDYQMIADMIGVEFSLPLHDKAVMPDVRFA